jgi:lysophospholipase L1-like esterase
VTSDPVGFVVDPRRDVTVTLVFGDGVPIDLPTTHPGSRTTSYLCQLPTGPATDRAAAVEPPGARAVEHWFFIEALEVASASAAALAVLGDSLTDGRGSTTNGNDRWTDQLARRLHVRHGLTDVAVLNQGTGGNRLLRDGLGISGIGRLSRDVLSNAAVRWLIVFEGVNDIGTAEATEAAQQRIGDELIAAYHDIIARAQAQGIRVYGATLTPIGGHEYDDPAGLRERTRIRINEWIRTSAPFDAVLDFDAAVRDPADPRRVRADCDAGDGLHLSPVGYRALADAVPVALMSAGPQGS